MTSRTWYIQHLLFFVCLVDVSSIYQTNETLSIITNDALIAVNQDPNGSPASRQMNTAVDGGSVSLWQGSLVNEYVRSLDGQVGSHAHRYCSVFVMAVLNTSPSNQTTTVQMSDAFFDQVLASFLGAQIRTLICILM
jgi:hypothetical protein